MKKNIALLALLSLVSCAWINQTTDRLMGREERQPPKKDVVTKDQYNELLQKYESLKNKYEGTGAQETVTNHSISDNLVDDLKSNQKIEEGVQKAPVAELETVDVFSNEPENQANSTEVSNLKLAKSAVEATQAPTKELSATETNAEVSKFRQGAVYLAQGKNDLALKSFQELERSPNLQIRVRAIYSIGDLLYKQGEFDLAMQVFENIIENYAFSGVTISALKNLVSCSEKLNLATKQEKYKSMLTDIFGV